MFSLKWLFWLGAASPGDVIAVIAGCETPMILRQENDYYRVIGECFVMGLMCSELAEIVENGKMKAKALRLR